MWLQIRTGSRHGPVFSRKKGDCTEHSEHPVSGIFYLVVFAGADKKCIPLSYCMFLFFPVKAGPLAFDYIDLVHFLVPVKRGMPARQKFHDAERVGGAAVISREDKPGCHPGKTGLFTCWPATSVMCFRIIPEILFLKVIEPLLWIWGLKEDPGKEAGITVAMSLSSQGRDENRNWVAGAREIRQVRLTDPGKNGIW